MYWGIITNEKEKTEESGMGKNGHLFRISTWKKQI